MTTEHTPYEIFVSYARRDNTARPGPKGWVTALREQIIDDHRRFSTAPLRIFLDESNIRDMDNWRARILGALRSSKILLVCLSPAYFGSDYCRWEWDEYLRRQVHQLMGSDSIASVYFVDVPGSNASVNARWLDSVMRGNFTDIRPWFPEGAEALQREEVGRRIAKLGESLWQRIQRARRASGVPGNLRQSNPWFVGRIEELRRLHEQLTTGAVGVVTAVHGLGGQGKTELALAYAHGWADCYPAGLWVLHAESKTELLPLIGELAYAPELAYQPSEAEKNDPAMLGRAVVAELQRRAFAVRERDPEGGAAALLILDNVSDAGLLSPAQLVTLPRSEWLRIVGTTRMGPERLHPSERSLALIAVDSLNEDDALALVRDHQLARDPDGRVPGFVSTSEEAAAREIVRELGGFTLAVEQVAVYLGLHSEITPSSFFAALRRKGLTSVDDLAKRDDVEGHLLNQQKQLSVILNATVALLDTPARTALRFAALLPAESVPWPWLRTLVLSRHPELMRFSTDEPDPWLDTRRRLEGLRLLTSGDHPELARIHRLVAAHVATAGTDAELLSELQRHVAARAWTASLAPVAPEQWELGTLIITMLAMLAHGDVPEDLPVAAVFLSDKVKKYRTLASTEGLLHVAEHLLHERADADPLNSAWQRGLSVSYIKIGDVRTAQGNLAGALETYRAAVNIRERLVLVDPANTEWQRDVSVSHERIGNVLSAQGNLAAALDAYGTALEIAKRLAATDPTNAVWRRDLAVSHHKIGDVLMAQGNLAGALDVYRAALGIAGGLAKDLPAHATYEPDVAASLSKIGDVLMARGNLPGALDAYRAALAIAERLAAADPVDAAAQHALAISYRKVGDVLMAQMNPSALGAYRAALSTAERLVVADPANTAWQRDLSISQERMGEVLRAFGNLPAALESYRAAVNIRERLVLVDPANTEWQRDLAVSHNKIGDVLIRQGTVISAIDAYQAALTIRKRLASTDPANAEWQRDLSVSYEKTGDGFMMQGNLSGAFEVNRASLTIRERLAAAEPANATWQRDLAVSYFKLAKLCEQIKDAASIDYWRKCYEILSRMRVNGMFLDPQSVELLARLDAASRV